MSFRKQPFQFGHPDLAARREEFKKRFEEEKNKMFDTASRRFGPADWPKREFPTSHFDDPEWRRPFSHSSFNGNGFPDFSRMHSGWPNDDIEIPVQKETNAEQQPEASTSNGHSRHEPKVHHIPIKIEARDCSSSSGYGSDGATDETRSSCSDGATTEESKGVNASHPMPTVNEDSAANSETDGGSNHVRQIPIEVVHQGTRNTQTNLPNETARGPQEEPSTSKGPAKSFSDGMFSRFGLRKAKAAPDVEVDRTPRASSTEPSFGSKMKRVPQSAPVNVEKRKKETTPPKQNILPEEASIYKIEAVKQEANKLKDDVELFDGKSDKQYRFLDEMLTRCMLKLDNIDTLGNDDIRKMRKIVVMYIESCLALLEAKVREANKSECDGATSSKMDNGPSEVANKMDTDNCDHKMEVEQGNCSQNSSRTSSKPGENVAATNCDFSAGTDL